MKTQTIVWDNKPPIDRLCVIKGLPLDVYHSQCCIGPSVSSSNLRRVLKCNGGSPAHFFCEWSGNPNRVEPEDKPHFTLGRAVHHLMLGEPNFASEFVIRPLEVPDRKTGELKPWQSNRLECRAWMSEDYGDIPRDHKGNYIIDWLRANSRRGRAVLTAGDIENIRGMAQALGRDPLVQSGLLRGEIERSFIWQDRETGLWCKARPDAVPTESGDFADLKTTASVQYNDLARSVRDYAYHQQAALVAEGAKACAGIDLASFSFVFIEKTPPHCVCVLHLKPNDIAIGHRQNRAARQLIAACLRTKRWPGPNEGHIVSVELGDNYHERAEADIAEVKDIEQQAGRRAG
jgi:PDDEXK-like domain of unknown function (DUF3799)